MTDTALPMDSAPAPRALERAASVLLAIATALMLLIVALIVAQIAARNFWNIGLPRAEEISRYAGVICVYLTAPVLALKAQHVAVDVFVNMMPRLPRKLCLLIAEAGTLVFAAMSIWGGYLYLFRAWRFRTPALGMQNIWLYGPIVLCLVFLIIACAWRIWAIYKDEDASA